MTHEQAIEHYTELERLISVGAYLELQHDGSYPEDDGTLESTVLQSVDNLETWAEKQGLEFCWNHDSKTWSLVPIEPAISRCQFCGQYHASILRELCPLRPKASE